MRVGSLLVLALCVGAAVASPTALFRQFAAIDDSWQESTCLASAGYGAGEIQGCKLGTRNGGTRAENAYNLLCLADRFGVASNNCMVDYATGAKSCPGMDASAQSVYASPEEVVDALVDTDSWELTPGMPITSSGPGGRFRGMAIVELNDHEYSTVAPRAVVFSTTPAASLIDVYNFCPLAGGNTMGGDDSFLGGGRVLNTMCNALYSGVQAMVSDCSLVRFYLTPKDNVFVSGAAQSNLDFGFGVASDEWDSYGDASEGVTLYNDISIISVREIANKANPGEIMYDTVTNMVPSNKALLPGGRGEVSIGNVNAFTNQDFFNSVLKEQNPRIDTFGWSSWLDAPVMTIKKGGVYEFVAGVCNCGDGTKGTTALFMAEDSIRICDKTPMDVTCSFDDTVWKNKNGLSSGSTVGLELRSGQCPAPPMPTYKTGCAGEREMYLDSASLDAKGRLVHKYATAEDSSVTCTYLYVDEIPRPSGQLTADKTEVMLDVNGEAFVEFDWLAEGCGLREVTILPDAFATAPTTRTAVPMIVKETYQDVNEPKSGTVNAMYRYSPRTRSNYLTGISELSSATYTAELTVTNKFGFKAIKYVQVCVVQNGDSTLPNTCSFAPEPTQEPVATTTPPTPSPTPIVDRFCCKSTDAGAVCEADSSDTEKSDSESSGTEKSDSESSGTEKSDSETSGTEKSDSETSGTEKSESEETDNEKSESEFSETEKSETEDTNNEKSETEDTNNEKSESEDTNTEKEDKNKKRFVNASDKRFKKKGKGYHGFGKFWGKGFGKPKSSDSEAEATIDAEILACKCRCSTR
ncbi:hypothetical protein FVE85_6450 [Porphyridium purpureum]|uniref:Uncharacterized protein n=1 Tax=Porphyridium purpureum TaxID=35688 RepID=A0A5J4Z6A4_PORPP|nr:hypothetical protein FVE85_6450 [Porphyridium purpureum]|eukprot:POR5013..scf295_1